MHLDRVALDAYLSRSLDAGALRTIDDHVASCLQCLLATETAALDPSRWERRGILGRLAHVTPAAPGVDLPLAA